MISDPISHDEFKQVLTEVQQAQVDDLFPATSIEVKYEDDHRFHFYINSSWDSYESDTNGLVNRLRELAHEWRRENRGEK